MKSEIANAYVSMIVEGLAILMFMCAVAVRVGIRSHAI